MWGKLSELYGWNIPKADLERLTPALDSLTERARRALDRDLGTVEPVTIFRPSVFQPGPEPQVPEPGGPEPGLPELGE
jgi:hypothetical protein